MQLARWLYMRHNKVRRLFNVYSSRYNTNFAGNVWDMQGVCPAITTMSGGGRQPMIMLINETE